MTIKIVDVMTGQVQVLEEEDAPSYAVVEPVPFSITPLQLWLTAVEFGFLTPAEAELAASGNGLPVPLVNAINLLPEEQRPLARIIVFSADVVRRDSPIIAALGTVLGLTTAQIDNFFRVAGKR
jgi:hypothetical protein